MRIFLLSKADIFGNVILNRLLPLLTPGHQVHVYLSDRIFPGERGNPWSDAYMYCTRDYLLDTFFPALDRMDFGARAGGGEEGLRSFAALSARYSVPVTDLTGSPAVASAILDGATRELRPDVLFCCRHDFIVPERIYTRAAHGAYNLHSGALPAYRGPFCLFWAMRRRDPVASCTIHTLKPKVDTGDVVGMGEARLDYGSPILSNLVKLYLAGVDVFAELLPKLERGLLAGIPQPKNSGRYFPQPDGADCGDFVREGGRFVDADVYNALLGRYLRGVPLKDVVGGDHLPVPQCGEYRTDRPA